MQALNNLLCIFRVFSEKIFMNKNLLLYIIFLFLLTAGTSVPQKKNNTELKTTISFKIISNQLQFIPIVQNISAKDDIVKYNFKVIKSGHSGHSTSTQSGDLNIKANSEKEASNVSVDFSPNNKYEVDLIIQKDDKIITGIHKTYSGKEIQNHEY